jgi:hypothetical protein
VVKIPKIAKTAGWQQYDSLDHCARAAGVISPWSSSFQLEAKFIRAFTVLMSAATRPTVTISAPITSGSSQFSPRL